MNFVDNSGMEKRRHIRVPFREPITYYSIGSSDESKKTFEGKGFNLSVGGLLFICRTRFKPYEDLNLQFTLKFTGKTMEMAVWGQVVWMEELEADTLYNAGIKFQNLSQIQKDTLADFVNQSLNI